jgi:hypothetical protein
MFVKFSRGHVIKGNLNARSFNQGSTKMSDIQTSEMDAELASVNVGPWHCAFWYVFKGWTPFNEATFF